MNNRRILVIDDDPEIRGAFQAILGTDQDEQDEADTSWLKMVEMLKEEYNPSSEDQDFLFELSFASQGQEGFEKVKASLADNNPFAVACIDIRMPPGWDGMKTAAKVREIDKDIEIVIITAYSDRSLDEIVRSVGAPEKLLFLRKPFDPDELRQLALSLSQKWNISFQEEIRARALRESESRYRALVETTSDWVWESDKDGILTYSSPVCEDLYMYRPEEVVGKRFFEIILAKEEIEEFRHFFSHCVQEKTGFKNVERRCVRKDGETIYIESNATPVITDEGEVVGFRGIDRDITERKKNEQERLMLEEQYRQSQKMEALGTLAGGIAHDFNNVLTPIIGNAQLSLLNLKPDNPLYENIQSINESSQKAAELVRQILSFSRKQYLPLRSMDLNKVILDLGKMLRSLLRDDIVLDMELNEDIWSIHGDRSQVEQIVVNLVVNAQDAIPSKGNIIIKTENRAVSKLFDINRKAVSGDFIVLSVADTGMGMDKSTISKIFDPFYTTKEIGKGTGLGLSTVYGIVNQHEGHIRVETLPGKGTTVYIYFRKSQQEAPSDSDRKEPSIKRGKETILVAEDDREVISIITSILNHFGYKVIQAVNGTEAIAKFSEHEDKIDMLLTDIVMPEQGGEDVAKFLRNRKATLPVIFMSGHSVDLLPAAFKGKKNITFIQKPFAPQALALKVRQTFDRATND